MKSILIRFGALAACIAAAIAPSLGPAASAASAASAADSHAEISGSGSSWSADPVNQWIADVQSQGLQVNYSANGDSAGRQDFANKISDFAVTAEGYQGVDPVTGVSDTSGGRQYAYIPIVAGGTSFPYQIKVHGTQVKNLRLSGETLAKIFTGVITNWDDPEITQDNDGNAIPSLPIVPVVQSEGSGSTQQLTAYFASQYASIWHAYAGSNVNGTEYWPNKGNHVAENGSDGAMNYISSSSANGSIGYVEYSYALGQSYPVAKVLNKAGYYTLPTQYNVAVALEKAQINMDKSSPNYLLQTLTDVYSDSDPRTYPISSYSYMIIPTGKYPSPESKITPAKRQTISDFVYYSICQGQAEVGPIGYSPLPVNLVEAGFGQIEKMKQADPSLDLTERNVDTCNNPTFVKGHPNDNYLAQIAPEPLKCDKLGQTPCAAGVTSDGTQSASTTASEEKHHKNPAASQGTSATTTTGNSSPASSGDSSGTTSQQSGTSNGGSSAIVTQGSSTDPVGSTATTTGTSSTTTTGSSVDSALTAGPGLAGYRSSGATRYLAPIAVVLILLLILLPPFLARRFGRPKAD